MTMGEIYSVLWCVRNDSSENTGVDYDELYNDLKALRENEA